MASTMKRVVIIAIVLIVLAIAASAAVLMWGSNTPLEGARAQAVNTILDSSGIKDKIDTELRGRAQEISQKTGIPEQMLESGIDALDVKNWKATELPADAKKKDTVYFEYDGQQMGVTTYDKPNVVTVDAYGQEVTFEVPESAQSITNLLPYLDAAKNLGADGLVNQLVNSNKSAAA